MKEHEKSSKRSVSLIMAWIIIILLKNCLKSYVCRTEVVEMETKRLVCNTESVIQTLYRKPELGAAAF